MPECSGCHVSLASFESGKKLIKAIRCPIPYYQLRQSNLTDHDPGKATRIAIASGLWQFAGQNDLDVERGASRVFMGRRVVGVGSNSDSYCLCGDGTARGDALANDLFPASSAVRALTNAT